MQKSKARFREGRVFDPEVSGEDPILDDLHL